MMATSAGRTRPNPHALGGRRWDCGDVDTPPSSSVDDDEPRLDPQVADGAPPPGAHVAAYLFADIRGYTRYTEQHGADASARLVEELVEHAQSLASDWHGELRGTWGDQVLVVFGSARDAVRAALDLQRRVGTGPHGKVLEVGVGLDAGEPSGLAFKQAMALNLAARLCARAAAGEVLATRNVAHLAGHVPDIGFIDRGALALKGVAKRMPTVAVVSEAQAQREQMLHRRLRRGLAARPWLPWVAIGVSAAVVAALVVVARPWERPRGPLPAGAVALLDRSSGEVEHAVGLGRTSAGVALSKDALWVAGSQDDVVSRVDRRTRSVQTIPVDKEPVAVATSGTDVWVAAAGANMVTRVSTVTGRASAHIDVGAEPRGIAVGFGRVWVSSQLEEAVTALDAGTGRVLATISVGSRPVGVAVGLGKVWVANAGENTVSSIDPATSKVDASYPVGSEPTALAISGDGVWVTNSLGQSVTRLDPARPQDSLTVRVGDSPGAIAADRSDVWVGNEADGTVSRINSSTGRPVRTTLIGAAPTGLAFGGSQLWTATEPFADPSHRGGNLTVAAGSLDPDAIDAAASFESEVTSLVYDGLLGFERSGGPVYGVTANLALAIPAGSDGGRTWTMRLRSGVRYSDGTLVQAADFRRGMERIFTRKNPAYAGYLGVIEGSQRCTPAACHLDQGVTTTSDSVTFHLSRPDPDFVRKLALYSVPAPPDAPATGGFLGTGPYRIQSFTPFDDTATPPTTTHLVLVRNPNFGVRSVAAKQAGYADTITFVDLPTTIDVASIDAARLDVVTGSPDVASLAAQYPQRFREQLVAGTHHLVLDTHSMPFSDIRARQAVAYALDRASMAKAVFDQPVTCHITPPGYPGSGAPCRFTSDPGGSAQWTGPDLLRARDLVQQSGTSGATVNVYLNNQAPVRTAGPKLESMLKDIGYRPRMHYFDGSQQFALLDDPGVDMQMGHGGFAIDYPGWSQFYESEAKCTDADPAHPVGPGAVNRHYCNRTLDAMAERARQLELTNRHQAWQAWETYYAALENQAALIPFNVWRRTYFLSERVGNVQLNPYWGIAGLMYEQLWVR